MIKLVSLFLIQQMLSSLCIASDGTKRLRPDHHFYKACEKTTVSNQKTWRETWGLNQPQLALPVTYHFCQWSISCQSEIVLAPGQFLSLSVTFMWPTFKICREAGFHLPQERVRKKKELGTLEMCCFCVFIHLSMGLHDLLYLFCS